MTMQFRGLLKRVFVRLVFFPLSPRGGQRKRWEDNIREWTDLEFGKSQRAVESREKWRKLVAESSVVPPMTLMVKGLMMMMTYMYVAEKV